MQNIILIGFMASGKDSVGQAIARRSGLIFLATDRMIELAEKRSIEAIFRESGEMYFRRLEKRVLNSIKGMRNIVLATGGGMVIDERNRRLLARLGTVVHLRVSADTVRKRTAGDTSRPLLRSPGAIEDLLAARAGIYDFADHIIDTDGKTPDDIAGIILDKVIGFRGPVSEEHYQSIPVKTQTGGYNVHVGSRILENLPLLINNFPKRIAVISNPLVGGLYLDRVVQILDTPGTEILPIIIPDGERNKSLRWISTIYDLLLENRFDRSDLLIGLGGGVITDMTGFVASTLKRGCRLINIPTTLLAQADAGVGGKTGVNHASGKNLIGSFYQPEMVLADIDLLQTLPDQEYRNGLAEVIKTALIRDAKLFDFLSVKKDAVIARKRAALQYITGRCVAIKRDIVQADEKEISGARSLLNFGHTVGHMIEAAGNYRELKHGEAVAIGMVAECSLFDLRKDDCLKIEQLLLDYGLPITIPAKLCKPKLKKHLSQDKKIRNGKLKLPVLTAIGKSRIEEIPWNRFESFMDQI